MSEECTHDCSSCGASCDHNAEAKDLIAPLNKDSAIQHVYAIMSGKGGVGKSSTTACLASALAQSRDMADGTFSRSYIQPAGTVTATAVREGGKVVKTYIGGPVTLGEPFETEVKG